MFRRKYIFDEKGTISQILSQDCAEIQFFVNGKSEKALLKKDRFYYNGRLIPDNIPLSKYLRFDMQVKFSCCMRDDHDGAAPSPYHSTKYNWFVMLCLAHSAESSLSKVTISRGLFSVAATIVKITKRHGILATLDSENEDRIAFMASQVYLHGKRFSSSKMLNTQLCLDEKMFVDAVPCIPEEERGNCSWFATCAFQGKRPRFGIAANEFQTNYSVQKPNLTANCGSGDRLSQLQQTPTNLKGQLLKVINLYTHNPRTLFSTGQGYILDILNDEFGIIIGCFKKNVFQTILFHRKKAYLFRVPLARAKLSEVFLEGDRVKFIAVGAPPNFYTDWIAVQVSVADYADVDADSDAM